MAGISWNTKSDATEVHRLKFKPAHVTAGGKALRERNDLREEGYTIQSLPGGDSLLRLRHRDSKEVEIL